MNEIDDKDRSFSGGKSIQNNKFVIYVGKLIAAGAVAFIVANSLIDSVEGIIERQSEKLAFLKGGRAFWSGFEEKLQKLADEPDIEPERKEKVLEAIRKLSAKYRPYFNALRETPRNANQERKDGADPAKELPAPFLNSK